MQFLDARGYTAGDDKLVTGQALGFSTRFAEMCDRLKSAFAATLQCLDQVGSVPDRREGDQHISRSSQPFDLPERRRS